MSGIRTIWAMLRERTQTELHNRRPSLYLQSSIHISGRRGIQISGELTHRSYAVDVLKDITKPMITPNTVRSWLLTASFALECLSMSVMTGSNKIARDSARGG